jgi:hypothetical protein
VIGSIAGLAQITSEAFAGQPAAQAARGKGSVPSTT